MVAKSGLVRLVILGVTLLAASNGYAQGELRKTFFKDADAAKAAAESHGRGVLFLCAPVEGEKRARGAGEIDAFAVAACDHRLAEQPVVLLLPGQPFRLRGDLLLPLATPQPVEGAVQPTQLEQEHRTVRALEQVRQRQSAFEQIDRHAIGQVLGGLHDGGAQDRVAVDDPQLEVGCQRGSTQLRLGDQEPASFALELAG